MGTQNERALRRVRPVVAQVSALEPAIEKLSDEELKAKTATFRDRLRKGESLDQILVEAFAVVREASRRTLKMRHFDAQILGGMVLHQGKIAEMATGEGKTLVATLPVYLNALAGRGVHVVTVNDYLARRDRTWMGPVYEFLGLSIGVIQHGMSPVARKASYACDVTYGTNNEFGFDYLRDNMVPDLQEKAQRPLHYAIVDEVDSILIDEARTPLIISGPAEESTDTYYQVDRVIPRLAVETDFKVDEKHHTVTLTEDGIHHCEKLLEVPNLYEDVHIDLIHHVDQALRAHHLFKLDVDYVVQDGKVVIVDEFTGRLMPGRRFSDGLHQALEAKEKVQIERENQTLATITFQNYFRMYKKLSGMTGTAETEAVEFEKTYKLNVVVIPPNRTLVRTNHPDSIYKTEHEKFEAVVNEVVELHRQGRPVLIGTVSIQKSERLSHMFTRRGLIHSVLNAKQHEQEAEIIARAGQDGALTIATNMAGRGTDILLGPGVAQKGGLHVLGTERHEARRIDNQLRGRSGRQGDPGSSRFYLALEDELMRIFGSDRIKGLMERLGMEEGQQIEHPLVSRAIESAQKRVEIPNFEIRKHLLEYDNVMSRQREIIYEERNRILAEQGLKEHVLEMLEDVVEKMVTDFMSKGEDGQGDEEGLWKALELKFAVRFADCRGKFSEPQHFLDEALERLKAAFDAREREFGPELSRYLIKSILLQLIDSKWKEHLHGVDELREGIGLRAYGQRDPLVEYQHEAFDMFEGMTQAIKEEAVEFLLKVRPVRAERVETALARTEQAFEHPDASAASALATAGDTSATAHALGPGVRERAPEPVRNAQKVGRNDPCPCGSGKKYKKCHGG